MAQSCSPITNLGAALRAEAIYYECRNPPTVLRRTDATTHQARVHGKINNKFAFCMDISNGNAIRGAKIGYEANQIAEPSLFRRSESHRGLWGTISGRVFCRILSGFRNSTQG